VLGLLLQFIVGGAIGLFFGTIILYICGSIICILRGKIIDQELGEIRQQHNSKIKKHRKEYNTNKKEFMRVLRKHRNNISKMEVSTIV